VKKLIAVLLLYFATCLFHINLNREWEGQIFIYDASGYYLYLPATFIYHDIGRLDFYSYVDSVYRPSPDGRRSYGIYEQAQTGRRLNKYPLGLAIGELPFFLAADACALASRQYVADGYSQPYQYAIVLAASIWALIGLFFLGRFLILFRGENVAALTVLIIGGGTNVFCYSVTQFGFAHVYLFMLFAMVLYYTYGWHTTGRHRYIYWLSISLGLIVITRPTDILIALIPLLWQTGSREGRKNKIHLISNAKLHLLFGFWCFLLVLLPQLAYWKWVTGHLVHYSYEGEWFDFAHPRILKGLFSYRKGWFLYTPIAAIAMLGLIPLWRRERGLAIVVSVYFALAIYIVFSWHQWFYGWGFGCRPLIESLAVLGIPLASLIAYILQQRVRVKVLAVLVFSFFIWLNIYQTNQFLTCALRGDRIPVTITGSCGTGYMPMMMIRSCWSSEVNRLSGRTVVLDHDTYTLIPKHFYDIMAENIVL
jgi:hypothetical protein